MKDAVFDIKTKVLREQMIIQVYTVYHCKCKVFGYTNKQISVRSKFRF